MNKKQVKKAALGIVRWLTGSVIDLLEPMHEIMTKHQRTIYLLDMLLTGILLIVIAIYVWPSAWSLMIGMLGGLEVYLFASTRADDAR